MESYSPVQYVFREVISDEIAKGTKGKVFFFGEDNKVEEWEGLVVKVEEKPRLGIFITMVPEKEIRIDRIITLFGKPGAAFDQYESYANQCLSCTGGYEL